MTSRILLYIFFRLWVDLFNIREDGGSPDADLQWYKITDDVVPASITCIFDDPNTIYHIKAYNSQVEKICDVKLVQPGMIYIYYLILLPLRSYYFPRLSLTAHISHFVLTSLILLS